MKISKRIAAFLLAAMLAVSSGVTSAFAMTDQEFRDSLQRQIDAANKIAENDPATQAMKKEMEERERQEALNNPQNPNNVSFPDATNSFYSTAGWNYTEAQNAFALQNKEREKAGMEPLVWSNDLYRLACARAKEISGLYQHQRPGDNKAVWESQPYGLGWVSENIHAGFRLNAQEAINGWMQSDSHKAALLEKRYLSGAIGCYIDSKQNICWSSLFSLETKPVATDTIMIQNSDQTTTELPGDEVLFAGSTAK